MDTVYARRHKTRPRVLCGRKDHNGAERCNGVFGDIREFGIIPGPFERYRQVSLESERLEPDSTYHSCRIIVYHQEMADRLPTDGSRIPILCFSEAWILKDGLWQMGHRAMANLAHGREARASRKRYHMTLYPVCNVTPEVPTFPFRAKCPECGCVNIVDAEKISVSPCGMMAGVGIDEIE